MGGEVGRVWQNQGERNFKGKFVVIRVHSCRIKEDGSRGWSAACRDLSCSRKQQEEESQSPMAGGQ